MQMRRSEDDVLPSSAVEPRSRPLSDTRYTVYEVFLRRTETEPHQREDKIDVEPRKQITHHIYLDPRCYN